MLTIKATVDGVLVVDGMFKYCGTHGLAVEDLLIWCKRNHRVIDWLDFVLAYRRDGAGWSTIESRISAAASLFLPPAEQVEFRGKLKQMVGALCSR